MRIRRVILLWSNLRQIRRSPLFDAEYYLASNPDVRNAGVDPAEHYLTHGWRENRDPSATFSTSQYLFDNPDVARAGVNPLVHYLRHGLREGRLIGPRTRAPCIASSPALVHSASGFGHKKVSDSAIDAEVRAIKESGHMGSEIIANDREGTFTVAGVDFRVHLPGQPVISTTENQIVVLKPAHFLRKYDQVFKSLPSRNVLEVGVAEGGSIIYFALAFPELKFVGIDLRPPSEFVLRHIERLGLSSRIKLYYGTDQSDTRRIHEIIRENFGEEPLGAVTEDASHFYAPSKRTFESTFGLLATGGTYCLEDWAWAHEPGPCQSTVWMDQPALSNLLFEIVLLQPSAPGMIGNIRIDPSLAFIERGSAPSVAAFNMDEMILCRGKRIQLI